MAWTSGALSTSNSNVKYTITIDEKSTSVANNTSNVTVSVRFYRTNSGYSTYGSGTVYCTINGTQYTASVTSSQKITNSGIVLFSKNLNIGHDSNGAKTLTVSAHISISGVLSSNSQSYSHALTTIPRASGLTVGNGTLGSAQTITADRKSSSFTHTLTWKCGSYSGTIASKSTATSWTFTPELKLATGAPYGTSVYCEFTLTTYNGSTSVGSVTKAVYLAIPSSVKPTVSSLILSDSKGYLATYGGYIQGQSVLHVVVNTTQAQGSPISSYSTVVDGSTYTSQTFNVSPIRSSGTVAVKATVKDGRGRSSDQKTSNITVLPYSVPKISKLSVKRCNQDGTDNDRGSYVSISISYSITSLSEQNSKIASLKYKKTSDTEWTTSSLTADYSVEDQTVIVAADDAYSYDVQLSVQDNFATSIVNTKVSTGYCLYHIPASGKGITFGGVAEKDGFNVKMDAHFANGMTEDIKVLNSGNCDELLTSGNYYIGTSGTNKPGSGLNGWLTVKVYGDAAYAYQTYVTYQGQKYERWRNEGTWGSWIHTNKEQKILWAGALHMNASQTITLSENITDQKNGVVLVFGEYSNNAYTGAQNSCHFIPKIHMNYLSGFGHCFNLTSVWRHGVKYLYVSNNVISGRNENSSTQTINNVSYENGYFILRFVYGV